MTRILPFPGIPTTPSYQLQNPSRMNGNADALSPKVLSLVRREVSLSADFVVRTIRLPSALMLE